MTKSSNSIPRPTESELELLRILWVKQPATVREIYDALNEDRPSGYTTVLKLMQIMTAKGLVVRDEANRAHVYRSAISQDAMQSKLLKDLSVTAFLRVRRTTGSARAGHGTGKRHRPQRNSRPPCAQKLQRHASLTASCNRPQIRRKVDP